MDDNDKEAFHNQLSAAVSVVPPHDILVILGDLNAVTNHAVDNSEVVGPFDYGYPNVQANDNNILKMFISIMADTHVEAEGNPICKYPC